MGERPGHLWGKPTLLNRCDSRVAPVYAGVALAVLLAFGNGFGQTEEYVLKAGDVIAVSVVEHAEFSGRHKIRPDGRINYPVIGEIEVGSLTCAQLVKIMQGKLSAYVNNPVVSVSIEAYYANKVYIIGDVRTPGQFEIYEPMDVLRVIAMAGGLNSTRTRHVKIIRADGTVVPVNMDDFYKTGTKRTKNHIMYPGDTLYIPASVTVPWALISTILSVISTSLTIFLIVSSLGSR